MKNDSETFPLRLPKTMIAQIRLRAERERRTMANLVRLLIENGLALRKG